MIWWSSCMYTQLSPSHTHTHTHTQTHIFDDKGDTKLVETDIERLANTKRVSNRRLHLRQVCRTMPLTIELVPTGNKQETRVNGH